MEKHLIKQLISILWSVTFAYVMVVFKNNADNHSLCMFQFHFYVTKKSFGITMMFIKMMN